MESAPEQTSAEDSYIDPEAFSISAQGMDFTFFPAGKDRLQALLDMIGEAKSSLKLYYYVFSKDGCAAKVRDALAEAAGRGVSVTLILDGFGAEADDEFLANLIDRGGRVLRFQARWNIRYLIRNHQKIFIADDKAALIGGFNIEQAYFDPPGDNGWHDLGVCVKGDAVAPLVEWYSRLEAWTSDPKAQFFAVRRLVRRWRPGKGPVQWLIGGPTRNASGWARSIKRDLARAESLHMVMAYFSPAWAMLRRIQRIGRSGTALLMLPSKSDNTATIAASRALYGGLLRRGVEIYEFRPCKLHTKLIVVDDVVYVGSANFDMRSLHLNLELMLRVEDAELAKRMRDYIESHRPFATHITQEVQRQRRTPINLIRWWVSWWLVTVADYTVTRRLNV